MRSSSPYLIGYQFIIYKKSHENNRLCYAKDNMTSENENISIPFASMILPNNSVGFLFINIELTNFTYSKYKLFYS